MKRLAQSSNIQTVRYYSTAVACRLQILAARPANPNRKKLGKQQEKKEKKGHYYSFILLDRYHERAFLPLRTASPAPPSERR